MENDIIKQLEFRYKLKKILKKNSFEELFEQGDEFLMEFSKFKHTRIGKIWLNKPQGQAYQRWNYG